MLKPSEVFISGNNSGWMTQEGSKQPLLFHIGQEPNNEQGWAGNHCPAQSWQVMIRRWWLGVPSGQDVGHVCRRPEQNPKKYLLRKLCFAASFSPLHHFTLMSYPSSGLASALGPPSMKVPILLLERSRFSWVPAKTQRGDADGLAYEELTLVEKTGAPHWKNETAQFLSNYLLPVWLPWHFPKKTFNKAPPIILHSYRPYSYCLTTGSVFHSPTFPSQSLIRLIWSRTGRVRVHPEVSWEDFIFFTARGFFFFFK